MEISHRTEPLPPRCHPRLSAPSGLFVDTNNDRLYVASNGNNSILIFNNSSSINGETIPDRVVSGNFTNLADPVGVFVDTTQNILYVTGDTNILAFDVSDTAFNSPVVSSTATGGTLTTLTDTSQNFKPDQFVNFIVKITGGIGAGVESLIIGNDTNTLTIALPWPIFTGDISLFPTQHLPMRLGPPVPSVAARSAQLCPKQDDLRHSHYVEQPWWYLCGRERRPRWRL